MLEDGIGRDDLPVQLSMTPDQNSVLHINIQSAEVHYRSGVSMLSHYHDQACLVLMLSGSVTHTEGFHSTVLQPRSVLYLPPAERHADVLGEARCELMRTYIKIVLFEVDKF